MKMDFFIYDLHGQIQKLHVEQFTRHRTGNSFTVYRGQGISKAFNSFLSTSKKQGVSLLFTESVSSDPDLVSILFVVIIDPSKSAIPFASVTDVTHFREEDEVLFSMHTIFRIRDTKAIDKTGRLFQVDLIFTQ